MDMVSVAPCFSLHVREYPIQTRSTLIFTTLSIWFIDYMKLLQLSGGQQSMGYGGGHAIPNSPGNGGYSSPARGVYGDPMSPMKEGYHSSHTAPVSGGYMGVKLRRWVEGTVVMHHPWV